MIEELFDYYKKENKIEWLPNNNVDIYEKSIKQEEHIGFVIYFNNKNKEYAITVDTEMIFILKKKKYIFTNKTYWHQINHIHLNLYEETKFKEKVIEIVDGYLK